MKTLAKKIEKNKVKMLLGLAALVQFTATIGTATASALSHYQPKLPSNVKR